MFTAFRINILQLSALFELHLYGASWRARTADPVIKSRSGPFRLGETLPDQPFWTRLHPLRKSPCDTNCLWNQFSRIFD